MSNADAAMVSIHVGSCLSVLRVRMLQSRVQEMTNVFHGVTKVSRLSGENLVAVLGSNHEPIVA